MILFTSNTLSGLDKSSRFLNSEILAGVDHLPGSPEFVIYQPHDLQRCRRHFRLEVDLTSHVPACLNPRQRVVRPYFRGRRRSAQSQLVLNGSRYFEKPYVYLLLIISTGHSICSASQITSSQSAQVPASLQLSHRLLSANNN